MRFDVSELKERQTCKRKWQFSSRNAFHMRSRIPNENLTFGSLFHECLASLYMGGNMDRVIEQGLRECQHNPTQQKILRKMLEGYCENVLPEDLERFQVLDIERSVKFYIPELLVLNSDDTIDEDESVHVCGSIDALVLDRQTKELFGLEHKSAKKLREKVLIIMDEQPRTYYIQLMYEVERMNKEKFKDDTGYMGPYTVGGIYINEVQKLQTKFAHQRTLCRYSQREIDLFWKKLIAVGRSIQKDAHSGEDAIPSPGYMSCQMCDYSEICEVIGFGDCNKEAILEEFAEEFEVREHDHLDEKSERKISG